MLPLLFATLPPVECQVIEVRPEVVVIGDSISFATTDDYRLVLPDVVVDARRGRAIDFGGGFLPETGQDAIRRQVAAGARPDVWVIEQGTNNIVFGDAVALSPTVVADTLDLLPADARVVWVDVVVQGREVASQAFNAQLDDPRIDAIVPWNRAVTATPALLADGIHPTPVGEAQLAAMVANAVDAAFPAALHPTVVC